MKRIETLMAILALVTADSAVAQVPAGTLRVLASSAQPSGRWSGDLDPGPGTLNGTVEADTAVAFGFVYEIRLSDRVGLESGLFLADFDFDLAASGGSGQFGSALAVPITLGVDFHPLKSRRVDLYIGPLISYTLWGDLETPVGDVAVDADLGVGAVAGVDILLGRSDWIFAVGVRYVGTSLSDSSIEIDVDPILAEVGLGYRF